MRNYIRLITALAVMAFLFGCSKLTMENYSKIKMGLKYPEVVKILGKPDSCSEALFAKSCVWGNDQKNITVQFMGDNVVLFTSKNIK
jgi:Domain of Unknown Function with PDB structure (DUF3862)